jgi:hypothetical protein
VLLTVTPPSVVCNQLASNATQARGRDLERLQYYFCLLLYNLDLIRFRQHFNITKMSGIAAKTVRQASRVCAKQSVSTAGRLRAPTNRAAAILGQNVSRRGYVSESKKDNAQVSIDTAVRADQKAFFQETSKLPENHIIGGTNVTADAMMSPMAGK